MEDNEKLNHFEPYTIVYIKLSFYQNSTDFKW